MCSVERKQKIETDAAHEEKKKSDNFFNILSSVLVHLVYISGSYILHTI